MAPACRLYKRTPTYTNGGPLNFRFLVEVTYPHLYNMIYNDTRAAIYTVLCVGAPRCFAASENDLTAAVSRVTNIIIQYNTINNKLYFFTRRYNRIFGYGKSYTRRRIYVRIIIIIYCTVAVLVIFAKYLYVC